MLVTVVAFMVVVTFVAVLVVEATDWFEKEEVSSMLAWILVDAVVDITSKHVKPMHMAASLEYVSISELKCLVNPTTVVGTEANF